MLHQSDRVLPTSIARRLQRSADSGSAYEIGRELIPRPARRPAIRRALRRMSIPRAKGGEPVSRRQRAGSSRCPPPRAFKVCCGGGRIGDRGRASSGRVGERPGDLREIAVGSQRPFRSSLDRVRADVRVRRSPCATSSRALIIDSSDRKGGAVELRVFGIALEFDPHPPGGHRRTRIR